MNEMCWDFVCNKRSLTKTQQLHWNWMRDSIKTVCTFFIHPSAIRRSSRNAREKANEMTISFGISINGEKDFDSEMNSWKSVEAKFSWNKKSWKSEEKQPKMCCFQSNYFFFLFCVVGIPLLFQLILIYLLCRWSLFMRQSMFPSNGIDDILFAAFAYAFSTFANLPSKLNIEFDEERAKINANTSTECWLNFHGLALSRDRKYDKSVGRSKSKVAIIRNVD